MEAPVDVLLVTSSDQPTAEVLPALALLGHSVSITRPEAALPVVASADVDVLLVDARRDLAAARSALTGYAALDVAVPVVAVMTEGGLIALSAQWPVDDVVLDTVGPAELDARLRWARERRASAGPGTGPLQIGELTVDEATYTARLAGRPLDLTYKEFELLKFLVQHPARVFTRSQLLSQVWGYDYFGGTRTVDVHVRRLRSKLGPEHEAIIGTVRNVGYKLVRPAVDAAGAGTAGESLDVSVERCP
jgi:DNA-binding response OmpR family regulator